MISVAIKHMLLWRFLPDVSEATKAAVIDELNALPSHFSQMHDWALGANVSERDDTFTHAFVVDFGSIEELDAYLHSERHEEFVTERWRQHIAQRAIVSFEYEAGATDPADGSDR